MGVAAGPRELLLECASAVGRLLQTTKAAAAKSASVTARRPYAKLSIRPIWSHSGKPPERRLPPVKRTDSVTASAICRIRSMDADREPAYPFPAPKNLSGARTPSSSQILITSYTITVA